MKYDTKENIAGYTALFCGAAAGLAAAYVVAVYLPIEPAIIAGRLTTGALAFIVSGVSTFFLVAAPAFWWANRGSRE